jgi:hypothetical protein
MLKPRTNYELQVGIDLMKYVPTEEQHRLWIQRVTTERRAGKSPEEVHRIIAEMIASWQAVRDGYR